MADECTFDSTRKIFSLQQSQVAFKSVAAAGFPTCRTISHIQFEINVKKRLAGRLPVE